MPNTHFPTPPTALIGSPSKKKVLSHCWHAGHPVPDPDSQIVLSGWVTHREHKWSTSGERRSLHCLRFYEEEADRRYGLEHNNQFVPFEFTTAFMLGQDSKPFAEDALAAVASEYSQN